MIAAIFALTLASSTFHAGAYVPVRMVAKPCGGMNRSPELHWSGVPPQAKSLAIVMHDPDAPHAGDFYHWALYDLAPSATSLPEAASATGATSGINDTGATGFFGPCPPPGKVHHYHITLYALDVAHLGVSRPLTAEALLARIKGHVIAKSTLIGLYATTAPR